MIVSVVIPCFNVQDYIAQCIQSLLKQQHKDLQIICVNNGSTDNTLSVLTRFATEHSSIITVVEEPKKGAPFARNRGLQEVIGTYVQFLDADDLLEPEKIAHQVAMITKYNNPDIIASDYFRQSTGGTKKLCKVASHDFWFALLYTQLGITSANLFKVQSVKNAGGFDVSLKSSQEYDLMFKMMKQGATIAYDAEPLTIVRDRESGSISQQNITENLLRYLDLRVTVVKHLNTIIPASKMQSYQQALFDAIRMLYKHDQASALKAFQDNFPKGFKPIASPATSKSYALLFRLFGFKLTEKIKGLFN